MRLLYTTLLFAECLIAQIAALNGNWKVAASALVGMVFIAVILIANEIGDRRDH